MKTSGINFILTLTLTSVASFAQTITTIPGDSSPCSKADGIPAVMACMQPSGIAFDSQGNRYLSDGQSLPEKSTGVGA